MGSHHDITGVIFSDFTTLLQSHRGHYISVFTGCAVLTMTRKLILMCKIGVALLLSESLQGKNQQWRLFPTQSFYTVIFLWLIFFSCKIDWYVCVIKMYLHCLFSFHVITAEEKELMKWVCFKTSGLMTSRPDGATRKNVNVESCPYTAGPEHSSSSGNKCSVSSVNKFSLSPEVGWLQGPAPHSKKQGQGGSALSNWKTDRWSPQWMTHHKLGYRNLCNPVRCKGWYMEEW